VTTLQSSRGRVIFALAFLCLCTPTNARTTGPLRDSPPDLIVIHATGGPTCDANNKPIWVPAGTLEDNIRTIEAHPRLGIHYMIDRDGKQVASIPENRVAYNVLTHSKRSIAIELINDGDGVDPFPEPQLASLVDMLKTLTHRYGIPRSGIKGHEDLDRTRMPCAPNRKRKVDPGAAFPWPEVLRRTFAPN